MDKEFTPQQTFEERRMSDIVATKELLSNPDLPEDVRIMHQHDLLDYEQDLRCTRITGAQHDLSPDSSHLSRFAKFGRFIRGNIT